MTLSDLIANIEAGKFSCTECHDNIVGIVKAIGEQANMKILVYFDSGEYHIKHIITNPHDVIVGF